jgi:glycolate oxidase FAD binding subunit
MSAPLLAEVAAIVGAAHCLTGAERARFSVEGRTPCAVAWPGSPQEVARVVAAAAAAGVPVIPWGGGTRMALGAPPREGALVVVTRRLARVVEHEPGDLTATVETGLTLEVLQAALGAHGQWLPLDPPDPGRATLGGVLATNAAGPRRHRYGTARDLVIGLRVAVADGTPEGALVRAGGKVAKNVAGYDLAKLYLGSLGTLGVLVEASLKLRPRPEADQACQATFPDLAMATAAAAAVLGDELEPYAVELWDPGALRLLHPGAPAGAAAVLLGFDGLAATVAWQLAAAERRLRALGASGVRPLEAWPELRAAAAAPLASATAGVPPAQLGAYLGEAATAVRAAGAELLATAHAGEGIVTAVLVAPAGGRGTPDVVAALTALRAGARVRGGHCVVEAAPLAAKAALSVWDPPGPAFALMRELKARLDPGGIMNPGRFVGGL